jgi:hypothetical protein
MIEIKAISIDRKIEAHCNLIKSSLWIHPEDHSRVMMSLYFEIENTGEIPIDEITFYFSPLIEITRIEDRTQTYSKEYREFIGANFEPINHPASYYLSGTTKSNILIKYDDPIPPKEIASTLFRMELNCSFDKKPFYKRVMGHGNLWQFEFWTWGNPPKLRRGHNRLNIKEEDIWIMIPNTLYRSSEFLHSNPRARLSRPLTKDEIEEGKYDKEWVHAGTYCMNWDLPNKVPMIPRQQTYSIRYVTQLAPFISLAGLFASIIALLSIGVNIESMTFLGQSIYLLIALIFIVLTLLATIYSYF